jgi:hypothetical protein
MMETGTVSEMFVFNSTLTRLDIISLPVVLHGVKQAPHFERRT